MGGRSLKLEPELRGEYDPPERLTRQRIGVKRVVGVGNGRTAWERGARDRRPRMREGTEGGWVILEVERRRLGTRDEIVGWRAVAAVVVAAAMARVRTRV